MALDKWRIYNPGYVLASQLYFNKFEVHFKWEYKEWVVAIVEQKKDRIDVAIKQNGKLRISAKVVKTPEGEHDFGVSFSVRDPNGKLTPDEMGDLLEESGAMEDIHKSLQFALITILTANAFLIYGNLTDDNCVRIASRNLEDNDKMIVFRVFEGKTYAVESKSHRSPEGIFSVRGHFRKYKDGKIVYIDEYLKGIKK